MRGSLLARLLAASMLIAVCSTAATVALAVRTTTGAIRQEQGRALASDNRVYTALLDYAATHRDWSGAGPAVRGLAAGTGRRIVLLTPARAALADSAPGAPVPRIASAVVDPLAVDPSLVPDAPPSRIAPRALDRLTGEANRCLGAPAVRLDPDLEWRWAPGAPAAAPDPGRARECLTAEPRRSLERYVAPAALLFITGPAGAAPSPFDLSTGNRVRIGLAAAAVLALTLAVTVLAAARLTRPLRALTAAAQRVAAGDETAAVAVRGRDEMARLAAAFNEMSAGLARSERLRRDMVGDIAHELRTPLSNIRGWLEAVRDGVADPDPALTGSLLDEALQLQRIVDDLQDLALADAGALRLHPEPARPADVLRRRAGVRYLIDDFTLTADPVRLRQIVDNLVANALRHAGPDGMVAVTARAEDGEAVIEVSDTGPGIAPDDLPHVFDRFWRADRSRGRPGGGSGLGLAIVRKLAEAHGGTAAAASTPGAGSTFTVRIPLHGGVQEVGTFCRVSRN